MRLNTPRNLRRPYGRAGFSLIEVLMSIFILGIGIISIAALFPAGIKQQQQSADDILGPKVAKAAMSVIRSKVRAEEFGTFEQWTPYGASRTLLSPRPTVFGDWGWLRPSFIWTDDSETVYVDEQGAIDIFSWYWWATSSGADTNLSRATDLATEFPDGYEDPSGLDQPELNGIPYDRPPPTGFSFTTALRPPRAIITQQERYYPQGTQMPKIMSGTGAELRREQPQYVWDCMFRRFQGRIQVAVFVYRVNRSGGEGEPYYVKPNYDLGTQSPPIPYHLTFLEPDPTAPTDLGAAFPRNTNVSPDATWDHTGPNDPPGPGNSDTGFGGGAANGFVGTDDRYVWGAESVPNEGLLNERQSWQAPRQWLLDQNARIHRVLSREEEKDDGSDNLYRIELHRPVPLLPLLRSYWAPFIVSDIWYIPAAPRTSSGALGAETYTPVYVLVEDL